MIPSQENIACFLSSAPSANESMASMFLEGSSTIEEAIGEFYKTPSKYSNSGITIKLEIGGRDVSGRASPPMAVDVPLPRRRREQPHLNNVTEAGNLRARDEQEMRNMLKTVQSRYKILNSDIEPEHEADMYCSCPVHQYRARKWSRLPVQKMWCEAVMYPGEKFYHDAYQQTLTPRKNPYRSSVDSPFGPFSSTNYWGAPNLVARNYTSSLWQTIRLDAKLNEQAQLNIDSKEPTVDIWEISELVTDLPVNGQEVVQLSRSKSAASTRRNSIGFKASTSRFSWYGDLKSIVISKSPEEKKVAKLLKLDTRYQDLRESILQEENSRWSSQDIRVIVALYQQTIGIDQKVQELRSQCPIQYLHLLRAGYFEPIPISWAALSSNPLRFIIDAAGGWRGITPTWRGYKDTAEERLYWVLNHRQGNNLIIRPDMISTLNMARERVERAVKLPDQYFSADDACHSQDIPPQPYSKQVLGPPLQLSEPTSVTTDNTMILLDVSLSMSSEPTTVSYREYLITGYEKSSQPRSKDVVKGIIRRFIDAMMNRNDDASRGFELTTFATHAHHMGVFDPDNFENNWQRIKFGGGARVMAGWQKIKQLHFQKHPKCAKYDPIFGWQASTETPTLRLLLVLSGEITDMDEFELDLLANSWAHVTIFLIGADNCTHHHRHANKLQRIGQINPQVSFVDTQGNIPERYAAHELLKRHLSCELSMTEFETLEQQPNLHN